MYFRLWGSRCAASTIKILALWGSGGGVVARGCRRRDRCPQHGFLKPEPRRLFGLRLLLPSPSVRQSCAFSSGQAKVAGFRILTMAVLDQSLPDGSIFEHNPIHYYQRREEDSLHEENVRTGY